MELKMFHVLNKAHVIFLILMFLLGTVVLVSAATDVAPVIYMIYAHDIRDDTAVISWATDIPSDGRVEWRVQGAPLFNGVDDLVLGTYTHYVVLHGLGSGNTIEYQVISQSGTDITIDDNGGALYTLTTGTVLGAQTVNHSLSGLMYESDGSTAVPDGIVYLRLHDNDGLGSPGSSQWVAARTNQFGYWSFDLGGIRTADAQNYFDFTVGDDQIQLVWQGSAAGAVGETGDERYYSIPADGSDINMSLDDVPTAVELDQFDAASWGVNTGILIPVIISLFVAGVVSFLKNRPLQGTKLDVKSGGKR